ncbi:hypothetical protein D3C83_48330 [compost metagenome]
MLEGAGALGYGDHAPDIRIGRKHAFRAAEHQDIDLRPRPCALEGADERRGEQHVPDAAGDDNQNAVGLHHTY